MPCPSTSFPHQMTQVYYFVRDRQDDKVIYDLRLTIVGFWTTEGTDSATGGQVARLFGLGGFGCGAYAESDFLSCMVVVSQSLSGRSNL